MVRELQEMIPNGWEEQPSLPCVICQSDHLALVFANPKNAKEKILYCYKKGVTYKDAEEKI